MKCSSIFAILLVNGVLCRAPGDNRNRRWGIKRPLFPSITKKLSSSKTPLTAKDFVNADDEDNPSKDSFLEALEFSRLPCQLLEDPSDCNEPTYLFPNRAVNFDSLCRFNKCLTGADYLSDPQHAHMYSPLDPEDTYTQLAVIRIEKGKTPPSRTSPNVPNMRFSIQFVRNKKKGSVIRGV